MIKYDEWLNEIKALCKLNQKDFEKIDNVYSFYMSFKYHWSPEKTFNDSCDPKWEQMGAQIRPSKC